MWGGKGGAKVCDGNTGKLRTQTTQTSDECVEGRQREMDCVVEEKFGSLRKSRHFRFMNIAIGAEMVSASFHN